MVGLRGGVETLLINFILWAVYVGQVVYLKQDELIYSTADRR
jgi:hypothetical protein